MPHTLHSSPESLNPAAVHTLVHLGAGRCRELSDYLDMAPQRMLLVEADPHASHELRARTAELDQIEIAECALASESGPVTLYRYNLPDANSLLPAAGLRHLFPGLKLQDRLEMQAQDPAALLTPLELSAEDEHLLVVDLPGQEHPVLEALARSEHLQLFEHLHVYCGLEPLYESSQSAEQVIDWLKARFYDLVERQDRQDPDQPCWVLQLNRSKLDRARLQRQLDAANAEKLALQADHQRRLEAVMAEQAKLVEAQRAFAQERESLKA